MQQTDLPVLIATKYFPLPWRFTATAVTEALTASLRRLQVNQVMLYQVHWPFDWLLGQTTLLNTLAAAVKEGTIAAVGVSNYSAVQMQQAHELLAAQGIPLAANQVCYSLLTRQIEHNGILQMARDLDVTILAYSPLAQGLLSGKYTGDRTHLQGARRIDPRFSGSGIAKISPLLTLMQELAAKYTKTPAQVALNWLIAQGNVLPIPGAKNAKQARENAGALGWCLNPDEIAQLDQVSDSLSNF
ncbi:aldo/keto reductase [Neosynechococcus sphagnicola]|uniref:aldo/keto reductase n=1 Tax=Neosynechococcus sphagnicola TaxID=1501145 RepID=UPI000AAC0D20